MARRPQKILAHSHRPSVGLVQDAMRKWGENQKFKNQEAGIKFLFLQHCPKNQDVAHVLLKVTVLNAFYHTSIFDAHSVAKRIVFLGVDDRLAAGDVSLVKDMTRMTVGGAERNLYSFASKYCCQHNPEQFPIYDSFVDKMLNHFRDRDGFSTFSRAELKDYRRFVEVISEFRSFYGLQSRTLRDIDRFLWFAGKEALASADSGDVMPAGED